jgi:hypothetical protein
VDFPAAEADRHLPGEKSIAPSGVSMLQTARGLRSGDLNGGRVCASCGGGCLTTIGTEGMCRRAS